MASIVDTRIKSKSTKRKEKDTNSTSEVISNKISISIISKQNFNEID